MTQTRVYLDNNATTAVAPECRDLIMQSLFVDYGNPSSKHSIGEDAKTLVRDAREQVASLLGASIPEIVFTGSGTEAVQSAIRAALALAPEKRHVITSSTEHSSSLLLLRHLEATANLRVTYLLVDQAGRIDIEALRTACTPDTALITVAWANNETGVLFPIEEIAAIASSRRVLLHVDAVQAAGKVPIDLRTVPVDLLSLAGHKLHGPKGTGALFIRKGLKPPAVVLGHQERGRRGGTENVPSIVGFGMAAQLAKAYLQDATSTRVAGLRERLEQRLLANVPDAQVNGAGALRVANTSSISFPGTEAEILLDQMDRAGICASAGAACSAGSTEPSHVLLAMGLDAEAALATVRFSLSRYSKEEEIDYTISTVTTLVTAMSAAA